MKPLKKPSKTTNKIGSGILVAFLLAGSLIYLGISIERSRYDKPLPANQYCQKAMEAHTQQLKATLDAQFGVETPKDTPTLEQVKELQKQCSENQNIYQVEVR